MFDYIKDHALKNVWCAPDQDNQLIIEPTKLTKLNGAFIDFKLMWRTISLPDKTSKWHIYQIGQIHPLIIGLFPKVGEWVSFTDTCNSQKMICDIYLNSGIQLPRIETFYMYSSDRDLIIAVRENKNILFDFNNDKVFIRVYTNEYFSSMRSDALIDTIFTQGMRVKTVEDILSLQNTYNSYKQKNGVTYSFVNGYNVESIDLINLKIGDVAEFVYDSSINKIIEFKIGDLNTFVSTLDSKIKYLLHYEGSDENNIDYQDDIDFFIIDKYNSTRHRGVYFHKNQEDSVRMLTHRDYSLVVPYVLGYVNTVQTITGTNRVIDPNNLIIRLHIRKSGFLRPIIFEHNRIKELYKLKDSDIINAMVGIDSVIPNWRAENLESSDYTAIMRSHYNQITNEMVQNGYGYNSISKIIADTPQKTRLESSRQVIDVPYGLQNGCTAYEYNSEGHLLGYYFHSFGSKYSSFNITTRLIELISGRGMNSSGDLFGSNLVPVTAESDFKVYACDLIGDIPNYDWRDVTDTNAYSVVNNRLVNSETIITQYFCVRTNNTFLAYDLDLPAYNGELKITLTQFETRNSITSNWIMQIPRGEIDVFLNGKSLIKNLDYFLRFPDIVITNKEYLINTLTDTQKIHIRFTGFCDKDFNITYVNDAGFIEHDLLSNNNVFDIRDDKVLRIISDGKLRHRDDLLFSELHSGVSIVNSNNGRPYLVKDIVVPLKKLTTENTYSLRDKSLAVDKSISDYLTIKIPEPIRIGYSAIENKYQIYSPFICKIIYDLINGILVNDKLFNQYSDNDVTLICLPYEYLLAFDPTQEEQSVDKNFVSIQPHNLFTVIDLNLFHYRFIERVIKLYSNGLISISPFIRIKSI